MGAYTEATLTTSIFAQDDTGNPNDTYTLTLNAITALRDKIQSNASKIIYHADIDQIRTLLTDLKAHTHSYTDYEAIADYGNNGVRTIGPNTRTSTQGRKSTGFLKGTDEFENDMDLTAPAGFAQNSLIYASHHNKFQTNYNMARSHYHTFADDTYYFEDPPPPPSSAPIFMDPTTPKTE